MTNLIQQTLFLTSRTPLTQFQRFRGKINIQRPREPHYERARVIAVTQPIYKEQPKARTCFQTRNERIKEKGVENPYNDIIAREVRNWLDNSSMVAVFHLNSISADEIFRVRVQLHKQNMHLKSYGRKIIDKAVTNTRYEALLQLFDSNHCIVFSPEQRVANLLRITRRVPQMILLGGIVENTLLSRNALVAYSQLPSLDVARAELVHTLNLAAGSVVQKLEAHQQNLVRVLDAYAQGDSTKEPPTETGTGDEQKS